MSKRKIKNHYRGRRYAKKRWPHTFELSRNPIVRQALRDNADRFIEAITMAYCAGLDAGFKEGAKLNDVGRLVL